MSASPLHCPVGINRLSRQTGCFNAASPPSCEMSCLPCRRVIADYVSWVRPRDVLPQMRHRSGRQALSHLRRGDQAGRSLLHVMIPRTGRRAKPVVYSKQSRLLGRAWREKVFRQNVRPGRAYLACSDYCALPVRPCSLRLRRFFSRQAASI